MSRRVREYFIDARGCESVLKRQLSEEEESKQATNEEDLTLYRRNHVTPATPGPAAPAPAGRRGQGAVPGAPAAWPLRTRRLPRQVHAVHVLLDPGRGSPARIPYRKV